MISGLFFAGSVACNFAMQYGNRVPVDEKRKQTKQDALEVVDRILLNKTDSLSIQAAALRNIYQQAVIDVTICVSAIHNPETSLLHRLAVIPLYSPEVSQEDIIVSAHCIDLAIKQADTRAPINVSKLRVSENVSLLESSKKVDYSYFGARALAESFFAGRTSGTSFGDGMRGISVENYNAEPPSSMLEMAKYGATFCRVDFTVPSQAVTTCPNSGNLKILPYQYAQLATNIAYKDIPITQEEFRKIAVYTVPEKDSSGSYTKQIEQITSDANMQKRITDTVNRLWPSERW